MPDLIRPDLIGDEFGPWGDYLELIQSRPAWWADALCPEYPDVDFFAAGAKAEQKAKDVCGQCLSLFECRQWALEQGPDLHGVFGGLSQRDRRGFRNTARKDAA